MYYIQQQRGELWFNVDKAETRAEAEAKLLAVPHGRIKEVTFKPRSFEKPKHISPEKHIKNTITRLWLEGSQIEQIDGFLLKVGA